MKITLLIVSIVLVLGGGVAAYRFIDVSTPVVVVSPVAVAHTPEW